MDAFIAKSNSISSTIQNIYFDDDVKFHLNLF